MSYFMVELSCNPDDGESPWAMDKRNKKETRKCPGGTMTQRLYS